jgi:hypothetical protein
MRQISIVSLSFRASGGIAMSQEFGMEKIFFQLPDGEWHGARSESLWAQKINLSHDRVIYKIDNIPFYTKSVSLNDLVLGSENKEWGGVEFTSIVEHSGNSTYRIITIPKNFLSDWPSLEKLGCCYESSAIDERKIYAVNVPAESDIQQIYGILENGEILSKWIFEEGYFGHREIKNSDKLT